MLRTTRQSLLVATVATSVLGLALRVWHLLWGLPFNYDPAEQTLYDAAVLLAHTGHLDPNQWVGPSALAYLCSVPVYALNWLASVPLELVTGSGASPGMIAPDQWPYLAAGRVLVALLGAATVTIVAIGASRVGRGAVGPLTAALVLAVLPLHVDHSHVVVGTIPASFAVAGVLVASFGLLAGRPPIRHALLAFGSVGLACGFEPAGVLAVVPAIAAVLLHGSGRGVKLMLLVLGLGMAGIVFFVTTPLAVTHPDLFGSGWASLVPRADGGVASFSQTLAALERTLLDVSQVGPVIAAAALLSFATPLLSRCREPLGRPTAVLASFVLVWLVGVLSNGFDLERSAVLMAPAFALMAGMTIDGLLRYLKSKPARLLVAVLVVAAVAPTAIQAGQVADDFGLERTETQAYDWFVRQVPRTARIARDWAGPQLPPDYFAVHAERDLADAGLESLVQADPDYIVVSLPSFGVRGHGTGQREDTDRTFAEPGGFYRTLFESNPKVAFCPVPGEVVGPEIWVFPRSRRARALHSESTSRGECFGPTPF